MISRSTILLSSLFFGVATLCSLSAASTRTWVGTTSGDLNTLSNWDPAGLPTNDVAEFDSSISGVDKSPYANSDFEATSFYFPNSAQAFAFTFDNCSLTLSEDGITGNNTNTVISMTNTDNIYSLGTQLEFGNSSSTNSMGQSSITLINTGILNGTASGVKLSYIGDDQISISNPFTIASGGSLSVLNIGLDNTTGTAGNTIAEISLWQAEIDDSVTCGDNVSIHFSNSGTNNSITGGYGGSEVGYAVEGQLEIDGAFLAGDKLYLKVTNTGIDTSQGSGGNDTGRIDLTGLMAFGDSFTVGDKATILGTNSGTFSGTNDISNNTVGYLDDPQLYISNAIQGGDNFKLTLTNTGVDSGAGVGGNSIGYVYGGQLYANSTTTLGDNATIVITNSGNYSGSSTSNSSSIGYLNDYQAFFSDEFLTGKNFSLTVTNTGIDSGTGSIGANRIGYVDASQVEFTGACTIGDNSSIAVSNDGTSSSALFDGVGYIAVNQFVCGDVFVGGKNLNLTVTNSATITNGAVAVGYVNGDQIVFGSDCSLKDGTVIAAYNNGQGFIGDSQIYFQNGLTLDGKATLIAHNEGTLTNYGIYFGAGSGGDINVDLANSSLYIASNSSDFTIGQLNGDSTSFVQSNPNLIIATDIGVNANFSGDIRDFSSPSTLLKTGSGTQKLSGTNTLTGLTTIDEGTLILTGSLGGGLFVDTNGTLKGTGTVFGPVTSQGVIAPGESIGTIHFANGFTNNSGDYHVEVNGMGLSDLISVTGTTQLNGGMVIVSTVDGTYKFQDRYTIVESGVVNGTFTGVTAISSMVQPIISYDPQHVYLLLLTDIANAAETPNQIAVATLLDGIVNPTDAQNLLLSEMVDLSIYDARIALDSLSGYQHTTDLLTTMMINRQFIRRLYDPLRSIVTTEPCCECDPCCDPCGCGFTGWLDVGGSFIHLSNDSNAYGVHSEGYDITAGLQKTICNVWTVGIAGSYEQDFMHFKQSQGTERCNTWFVGAYGLYRPSCYYGLFDVAYGNSSNHLKRSIDVGSLHYHANSRPDINYWTVYGELGFDYNLCNMLVQPFFGIEAGWYSRKHVTESYANGWGLVVNKRNRTLATSRLGFHLTSANCCADEMNVSLDLAWNCLLSSTKNTLGVRFEQFGTGYKVRGTKLKANSIDYAVTVSSPIYCNLSGYLEASGESWSNANIFNIIAGVELNW